ncbi:MAG: tetratricopeptide repeat protein, partial [Rhodospirillaceae bacterium]
VTLLNRQKYAEAAPHLQYAVEQEPDNALALTNYGWLLAVMERDRQAMDIYERLLDPKFERQIDRTELFFGLAILYARLDQHEKGIALLEPEFGNVKTPHENNRVFLNLAEAYRSTGRLDDAAGTLDRLENLVPEASVGLVLARARLAAARDDFDGGASMLAGALKTHPEAHADIHLSLARLEMERKYHRRAIDAFVKAVEAAPGEDRLAILSEMTKSFAAAERSGDATPVLERFATAGGGQDAAISLLLAENLVQSGRKKDALSLLDRQIAANPKLAQAHLLKAVVLRGESRVAEARDAMRASVDADPANPAAWHLLADLVHDTDGDVAMLAAFKEGLGHNPTDPHLLLGTGSIAYSQGDVAYAAEIFTRLVARYPDDPMALSNAALAHLDLDRNMDKARVLLERALERAPRVPAIVDTWGWMLHKSGKSAEAIELLERVAQVLPDDGGVSYHLGIAYEATGQDGLGRASLRRALALGVPEHYRGDIVRRLSAQ